MAVREIMFKRSKSVNNKTHLRNAPFKFDLPFCSLGILVEADYPLAPDFFFFLILAHPVFKM
jgi:hypothetical protein